MGNYLNPGNGKFQEAVNSEIYIDKTGLLNYTNRVIHTSQKHICVSRPRRFGKSTAANMAAAYYGRTCDSEELFHGFEISGRVDFKRHLNKYDVVFLNMQEFLSQTENIGRMLDLIRRSVLWDLLETYPDFRYFDDTNLMRTMQDVYNQTKCPFVVIIDEWDCVFREFRSDFDAQKIYLDFLRDLLKDKAYIYLSYMTGILPIKKYGTHSALNMFDEFSMVDPGPLASFVGFTEDEVFRLCENYGMDMQEVKYWYDGYSFPEVSSIYNPRSVVSCVNFHKTGTYWNRTETFEALRIYIDMNFEGLKDDVLCMLAGEKIPVNTGSFANDMTTFRSKDDILTLLIHLGYLGYDSVYSRVFIPNHEVYVEYVNAISVSDWGGVSRALKDSAETLQAIWEKDSDRVAKAIGQAHFETAHLQYNDENALSYTISLALYAARNFYTVHREFPGGKGFADLVFIPRKQFPEKPALVIELKRNKSAEGAIYQIREREYCDSLKEYQGNLLLVGINYDEKTKQHSCVIEEWNRS